MQELYELASLLVRREEGHDHLSRATILASESFAHFDQREVIAQMGA